MTMILYSIGAGVIGMGLGAYLTTRLPYQSPQATSGYLSFSSGLMISIVIFAMVPEALEIGDLWLVIAGLIGGFISIWLLNYWLDQLSFGHHHHDTEHFEQHAELIGQRDKQSLIRAGITMLVAIGLHNFPEGMAIGASGTLDSNIGLVLSLLVFLHNVPEGMALASPLLVGGYSKTKTIVLTMVSGSVTVIGALVGLWFGAFAPWLVALLLSISSGSLLYVVFGEMLPQAWASKRLDWMLSMILLGLVFGLVVVFI